MIVTRIADLYSGLSYWSMNPFLSPLIPVICEMMFDGDTIIY